MSAQLSSYASGVVSSIFNMFTDRYLTYLNYLTLLISSINKKLINSVQNISIKIHNTEYNKSYYSGYMDAISHNTIYKEEISIYTSPLFYINGNNILRYNLHKWR